MLTPQEVGRPAAENPLRVVYVGDAGRGEAVAEVVSSSGRSAAFELEVTSLSRGRVVSHLADAAVDCVVVEADSGGVELLDAVADRHPTVARVLVGESVAEAPPDVAFVPTRPADDLAARTARRVERAVERVTTARERDRFGALFENTRDAIAYYEYRGDAPVVASVNDAFEDVFGYDGDEIRGESLVDYTLPDDPTDDAEQYVERLRAGEQVDTELECLTADGRRGFRVRTASVPGEKSVGYAVYTDVTERTEREAMLDALHEATRDLMAAESEREICETTVETARKVLDVPHASVFRWNDDRELLEPYVLPEDTVNEIGDAPTFERGEGIMGSVFDSGEVAHFDNAWDDPRALEDGSEGIRAFGAFPLGDWGAMNIASASVGAFDDYEIDLVRVLASNAEAALERAEREATLADQRGQLAELDRLNEVIRDVDQLLVRATTRDEIVQSVCDRLAAHYRFAWIGEAISGRSHVEPTASAGVEDGYLDAIVEMGEDAPDWPADTAHTTRNVCVVQNVRDDDRFGPWRDVALEREYRSMAAIPLRYRDTVYGVLCVYADRTNAFDARERAVLAELGDTIGHAINAAESRKALVSDGVVEIEFDIYDGDGFFARVPQNEGGRFSLEGVTMTTEGSFVYFMTVDGLDPDRLLELADDAHDVARARLVNEHDDGHLFEFVYTGPSPLGVLTDHGGKLREAEFTPDGGWSVMELPRTADVRSVVDTIQAELPDTEAVARRERKRSERTVEELRTALDDDLTDRQRSALEAAFYAGFFEWPRESTGEEISDSLGVSAPTFHQHLRIGEQKLLAAFLDAD